MLLPRSSLLRAALTRNHSIRTSRSAFRGQTWQQVQRRAYASEGGHETKKAGGDLPWLAGAIAVTLPSCWYLLQPSPNKGHGHGHGDEEHGEHEEHEEPEVKDGEGEASEESKEPEGESEEGKKGSEEAVEDLGQGESGDEPAGENSAEEQDASSEQLPGDNLLDAKKNPDNQAKVVGGGGNTEGVQFKGATSAGTGDNNEQGDTRKHIPDAKGGNKKRIESDYGIRQGVNDDEPDKDNEQSKQDTAAAAKPALSKNYQSGKQEGLSNTDTKHSTNITNDPEKSKKGEGTPETSKSKGTVDPKRPQAEDGE